MVALDHATPPDVVDRLLWQDAQHMLGRHTADLGGRCGWCGAEWPCAPRRLAEHAAQASRQPWRAGWTARHDLNGLRDLPGWRDDAAGAGRREATAEPGVWRPGRGGLFD